MICISFSGIYSVCTSLICCTTVMVFLAPLILIFFQY